MLKKVKFFCVCVCVFIAGFEKDTPTHRVGSETSAHSEWRQSCDMTSSILALFFFYHLNFVYVPG